MKKITLLLFIIFSCAFTWESNAQFTEGFDAEIPATWTIINEDGGTYTWDHQTQYPQAGAGHARIHWEAAAHEDYLITPQFTVTAGVSDRISFYAGIDGTFFTETFEVRISTTGNTAADFTTTLASETATTDADGNYTRYIYDIGAYDGQSIYVAIVATDTDRFYLYIDEFVNDTEPTGTLDYFNLQWPPNGAIAAGETFDVYAQAYEAGLTDVTSGQAPGIQAWIGYSSTDSDPSGVDWTWTTANFNAEVNNNDEYTLNLGSVIPGSGTYYYASRWSLEGGPFTYGGILADGSNGGEWGESNGVSNYISGVLTVNPPANDECANAVALTVNADFSCAVVTAGTIRGATDSGSNDATCAGTPDDDVWYTFVATSTAHRISLIDQTGSTNDMYMTFYDGTAGCGSLGESVACSDPQTANLSGLTIGTTYYIQVYTYTPTAGQTSSFNICVGTPPPPPANDTCEGALVLAESIDSSCSNAVTGTTVSALPSASGTCSTAGKDVWYTFTPSTTGNYNFNVSEVTDYGFSSTYVTLYSGACGTSTQIGSGCSTTSLANVELTASSTYYVVVRTTSSSTGVDFSLCAYPSPPPPANDLCSDSISLTCGVPLIGTTLEATGGNSSSCLGSIGNDVWYQYSGNDSTVELTVVSTTTGEEPQVEVFSSTDGTCSGFTTGASGCYESAGSGENSVVLSFEASAGTEYFIRIGNWINNNPGIDFTISTTCTAFPDCGDPSALMASVAETTADISWTAPSLGTPVGYNWEVQPDGVSQGTVGAITGTTATTSDTVTGLSGTTAYDLYVQTDCGTDGTSSWVGPYSFTTFGPPPANNDCANATMLTVESDLSCSNPVSGTTLYATQSLTGCVGTANDDVWYSFMATGAQHSILVTNTGGSSDIVTQVFDACGGNSLVCQDTPNSPVNVSGLTVGETYYFRIYTYSSTASITTNFNVCVGTPPPPPANDACSTAMVVTSLPFSNAQDATNATNNTGFIDTCTFGMNDGVWYSFTATTSGTVDIALTNVVGWDPELALYSGSCGAFTCVGSVDSAGGSGNETLTAQAVVAGTQYFINVGYYGGSTNNPEGPFEITITGSVTLNVETLENLNAFTYFPNPVKNTLNLRAQSNIQNVSIYNMLGQEVLRTAPNTLESEITMNALQLGAYFVKVTINDQVETIRVIKK